MFDPITLDQLRAFVTVVEEGSFSAAGSAVSARVLSGAATLGVVSPLGVVPGLEQRVLAPVRMIPVVGPRHLLAAQRGTIPTDRLAGAIQIVLSERNEGGVADQAVLSTRTWRVADLHTKHAMLRANLGWGNLPEHLARDDLRRGKLVAIRPAAWGEDAHKLYLSAVYRGDAVFGPAHRWLLAQLATSCARDANASRPARRTMRAKNRSKDAASRTP